MEELISFKARAQSAPNAAAGGYPYSLSGDELDKNFAFASLKIDPSLIEMTMGIGGHPARKLKIPAAPETGTHVLGVVNGALQWLATEEC